MDLLLLHSVQLCASWMLLVARRDGVGGQAEAVGGVTHGSPAVTRRDSHTQLTHRPTYFSPALTPNPLTLLLLPFPWPLLSSPNPHPRQTYQCHRPKIPLKTRPEAVCRILTDAAGLLPLLLLSAIHGGIITPLAVPAMLA